MRARVDFEWAAVVDRAPDDDERGGLIRAPGANAHKRERVAENLTCAFSPIGEHAGTFLQSFVHGVDDGAVGPRARDGKKVSAFARKFGRMCAVQWNRNTESDASDLAAWNQARRMRNVPGNAQFLSENVGGAGGEERHGDLASGEAVHDFVHGAITAAGDHHTASLLDGLASDIFRAKRSARGSEFGSDAGVFQQADGLLDFCEAAMATAPAGRVVNQQSVLNRVRHPSPRVGSKRGIV